MVLDEEPAFTRSFARSSSYSVDSGYKGDAEDDVSSVRKSMRFPRSRSLQQDPKSNKYDGASEIDTAALGHTLALHPLNPRLRCGKVQMTQEEEKM